MAEVQAEIKEKALRILAARGWTGPAATVRRFVRSIPLYRLAMSTDIRTARHLKALYESESCPRCAASFRFWRHDWEGALNGAGPCSWRVAGVRWVRWRCSACQTTFMRCEDDEED